MNKITFSVTTEEARNISTAIRFLFTGCTKATAENPNGINKMNRENMKLFNITKPQLNRLVAFGHWIDNEVYHTHPESSNRHPERSRRVKH